MCGRFASDLDPERVSTLFEAKPPFPNVEPSWNVAPTQKVAVVRRHPDDGSRRLDLLRWGLIPHWSKDKGRQPINARAETVATTGLFRQAFARRRCLVPARLFYEWDQSTTPKQPYAFARGDGTPLAFAGLWESWRDPDGELVRSFAIITTTANATLRPVHDRMPVVLEQADWEEWLVDGPAHLLRPAGDEVLERWQVSSRVNSPRNNDPSLIERVEAASSRDEEDAGPDSA
jgi:putative SOS response-associated peptidase YedK